MPSAACCASWPRATGDTSSWRSSPTRTERVAVARVLGARGLAGAVRIELLTDWPERLAADSEVYVEGESDARRIVALETGGRVPVITLDGISDRDAAARLSGRHLEVVPRELPDGSYYWHQLVGLRVTDERGADQGELVEVFRAGGNEVYRVVGPAGELLVPALRRSVARIDLDAGLMVVRPEEARPEEP